MHRSALAALGLSATALPAQAAELAWDGFYRARAEYFNSLSLSNTNTNAEGAALAFDHHARLQPGWLLSDHVSVFTQVDLLPFVSWGDEVVQETDPATGLVEPIAFSDTVGPPTGTDGEATLQNIQVTRLWAELHTRWGQVRFGRMPVHWGTGMVFNAGNEPEAEYGDTADRVQFTAKAGDVFVLGAWEGRHEGFLGERDDYKALAAAVMYRTEQAGLGFYNTYRWQSWEETKFGYWVGDLWGEAEAGPATVQAEFAAVFGSGDLETGANDVTVSSFGGNVDVGLQADRFRVGAGFGLAGGDADPTDTRLHTFEFDPDFNVGLMLFEEPMPVLEPAVKNDANGGRTYEALRTGNRVSNALYIRPRVGWQFRKDLTADLSLLAAQHAKVPEAYRSTRGYGLEVDGDVNYEPFPHFRLQATTGVFFPGKFFSQYEHEDLGGGFDRAAVGVRLLGVAEF